MLAGHPDRIGTIRICRGKGPTAAGGTSFDSCAWAIFSCRRRASVVAIDGCFALSIARVHTSSLRTQLPCPGSDRNLEDVSALLEADHPSQHRLACLAPDGKMSRRLTSRLPSQE